MSTEASRPTAYLVNEPEIPTTETSSSTDPSSSTATESATSHNGPILALPSTEATTSLEVGGPAVALDHLGPMVVNVDGTISRVNNWDQMTDNEKAQTQRLLARRNKQRLEALKAQGVEGSN
ncbi:hypothetical protein BJ508DRAFT_419921 [Ascobolus immersus RN42]|uniref:Uncharacterized protein n=1 Tax=Ascobolus immersus RN42 TaxID=1160509 RepID=A0A3N4HA47_ASCIM|nr:hypothetical protein BJ508DRAFT_419921 [Ascobolus immersus RN42]